MKLSTWAASLLISLLIILAPMAWASPVDATWVEGVYDDGDHDDVVTYLTSDAVGVPVLPIYQARLLLVFVRSYTVLDAGNFASATQSLHSARAPPLE